MKEKTKGAQSTVTQRTPCIVRQDSRLTACGNPMRIDFADFEKAFEDLEQLKSREVVIDLTRCTYASSLFIGALVERVRHLKERGKDVRVSVSPELGRFLNMARLFHLFEYTIEEQ
jgi:anti-anti-sigma factor